MTTSHDDEPLCSLDEALRRALNTPPSPKKQGPPKRKKPEGASKKPESPK